MKFPDHSIKASLLTLCILLAVIISQVFTTTPVSAATIIVNSTADVIADDGYCTLREAIIAANSDTASGAVLGECAAGSGTDEITLPADTYTLTSQLPAIASDITINGADAATTIIQASDCDPILLPGGCTPATYRILTVNFSQALTLDGVTLRHGTAYNGGAIYNNGSLTLTNSVVTANKASNYGGGIYNHDSRTLIVEGSEIKVNHAQYGGGIYTGGTVTLTNSELLNNTSDMNSGGVQNSGTGTLSINNSILSGNTAGKFGGGILSYGKLSLTGSNISGNVATANEGGGIFNAKSGEADIPTITNCTISENTAGSMGGGIRNFYGLNITNSTISDNESFSSGGGISNSGPLILDNTTISGNESTGFNGGGIYHFNNTLTLTNGSIIEDNTANFNGGGIYNGDNGVLNINASTLSGNIAANSSGGGIYNGATLNMGSSVVDENTAKTNGGGLYNAYNGILDISNATLSGNTAETSGGGISNDSAETAYVSESNLSQNHAKINGGGIFNNGSMILAASTLLENQADFHGGGIFNQSILSIVNSTFSANHAVSFGGGVANYFDLSLTNCTFYGNTADSQGGGVYNFASGSLGYANTILFNSGNKDCFNAPYGSIALNTHNLVANNADPPNACGIPHLSVDPQLAPLGDNGGPTQTYAIANTSPAFDAGDLYLCPKTDQRGVIRPQDWGCDIGAFEVVGVRHPVSLTVYIEPLDTGEVSKTPDAPYYFGDEVTLSAIPEPDWSFDHWSVGATGLDNPLIIRLQGDTSITAHFIESLSYIYLPLVLR